MKPFLIATAAATLALPVYAVGLDDPAPQKPTQTTTHCTDGAIWDEKTSDCVAPKESNLDDDALLKAARELAHVGQYEKALDVLAEAANPDDPRILNYKGFANRKAGRPEIAMAFYRRALSIDPDFLLARSYLGQALAEQGDLEAATEQLLEIRARGGRNTWAYQALKQALQDRTQY